MKDIDKLIFHYILEIIGVIVLVVFSYPIWTMFNQRKTADIAESYANMNYLYLDVDKYVLSNDFYDEITIYNDTNTIRGYNLVLKINKDKVDKDFALIINGKNYDSKSILYKTDKDNIYYEIDSGSLVASNVKYNISYISNNIKYSDTEYEIIENHEI